MREFTSAQERVATDTSASAEKNMSRPEDLTGETAEKAETSFSRRILPWTPCSSTNTAISSNTDVDKVWKTSRSTSYNPILSDKEIEAIKTDDGKIDRTCLGCLFRVRPWGGVYYRGYVSAWAPRYFVPSYNYWNPVSYGWSSYNYGYRYSWSSFSYNTYYYRGLWW